MSKNIIKIDDTINEWTCVCAYVERSSSGMCKTRCLEMIVRLFSLRCAGGSFRSRQLIVILGLVETSKVTRVSNTDTTVIERNLLSRNVYSRLVGTREVKATKS